MDETMKLERELRNCEEELARSERAGCGCARERDALQQEVARLEFYILNDDGWRCTECGRVFPRTVDPACVAPDGEYAAWCDDCIKQKEEYQ